MVHPGLPSHMTQRGNRCEQTFFEDSDYALYLDLLTMCRNATVSRSDPTA